MRFPEINLHERRALFIGPGLALPKHGLRTADYVKTASSLLTTSQRGKDLIDAAASRSGIEYRHSVLADEHSSLPFYSNAFTESGRFPGTKERMELYAQEAPALAKESVENLFNNHQIQPECITHLITVSCTGFMAPGIDQYLITELQLPDHVQRTNIGFQGCHGAINGLAVARRIAESEEEAVVLVVCAELCTLHMQQGLRRDDLLPNSLFADGAASFLVPSVATPYSQQACYRIAETRTHLIPGTDQLMSWKIGDSGFRMTLDSRVPDAIGAVLPTLLNQWGWEEDAAWAVHPGGPKVLSAVAGIPCIGKEKLQESYRVLRDFGNMSSPTLIFILERIIKTTPRTINMLAFGPGLNIEAAKLTAC